MSRELSSEKRKLSVIRIIIVSVICVLSVSCGWNLLAKLSKGKGATHVLNYGWDVRFNDQTYSGVDLRSFYFKDVKRGDTVELSCILPGDIPFDSNLIVPIHYYDARVYVNGELRLEADTDRYDRNQFDNVRRHDSHHPHIDRSRPNVHHNDNFRPRPESHQNRNFSMRSSSTRSVMQRRSPVMNNRTSRGGGRFGGRR